MELILVIGLFILAGKALAWAAGVGKDIHETNLNTKPKTKPRPKLPSHDLQEALREAQVEAQIQDLTNNH